MSSAWCSWPGPVRGGAALLIFLSAAFVVGCTAQRVTGAREYMPLTRPDAGEIPPAYEISVSLNKLKAEAIHSHQQGRRTSDLLLDGLTRIDGFKWTPSDIILTGTTGGNATPITLDIFVEALRLAEHKLLVVSLQPEENGKRHEVMAIPEQLFGTSFLRRVVAADYVAKAHVLGRGLSPLPGMESVVDRVERDILECGEDDSTSFSANLYFKRAGQAQKFVTSECKEELHVTMQPVKLQLTPGASVKNARAINFADEYTKAIDDVAARYSSIRDLHVAYELWMMGHALRKLALADTTGKRQKMLQYWITEYRPPPFPMRTELAGIGKVSLGRFCVKDGKETVRAIAVSGGVVLGDDDGIEANLSIKALQPPTKTELAIFREFHIRQVKYH